jgi:hypothetical protein
VAAHAHAQPAAGNQNKPPDVVPSPKSRGAAEKKMTKVTYICRGAKKKVVTYFFLFLFVFFIGFF